MTREMERQRRKSDGVDISSNIIKIKSGRILLERRRGRKRERERMEKGDRARKREGRKRQGFSLAR